MQSVYAHAQYNMQDAKGRKGRSGKFSCVGRGVGVREKCTSGPMIAVHLVKEAA
jgi:hypothetical protein